MTQSATRILHVISGLSTGGAEAALFKLIQGMDSSRFENSVVSLTGIGHFGPRIKELGVAVEALGMTPGIPSPFGLIRLIRHIQRFKPQVVQTWLYHADLLGLLAAWAAGNIPVVWNLRCSYMGEEYYRGMRSLVIRALARLSERPKAIVHNSAAGRELHLTLGYQPRSWKLIPNGFDTNLFRPNAKARQQLLFELGLSAYTDLVGMIGRFDAVKGHDTFFAAAEALLSRYPDAHFLLVGAGCTNDNPMVKRIIPKNVADSVSLLGERHNIPEITSALSVATCASIGEGFPNVIGEAMSCGVPCVVTNVGDCAEIVGSTGRVVPVNDPAAMARAWDEILSLSPESRDLLSQATRERIIQHYAISDVVDSYQSFYTELAYDTFS